MSTTQGILAPENQAGIQKGETERGPSRGHPKPLKALDAVRACKATYPAACLLPFLSLGHGWRLFISILAQPPMTWHLSWPLVQPSKSQRMDLFSLPFSKDQGGEVLGQVGLFS